MCVFCSGQCRHGGAGARAEEAGGGEVPEGSVRGDRRTLRSPSEDFTGINLRVMWIMCFTSSAHVLLFLLRPQCYRANSARSSRSRSGGLQRRAASVTHVTRAKARPSWLLSTLFHTRFSVAANVHAASFD